MVEKRNDAFSDYLKRVKWGVLTLVSIITAMGLTNSEGSYHFPPAGPLSQFVLTISSVAVLMALTLPWLIKAPAFARKLAIAAGLSVPVLLFGYFALVSFFVVTVDIPAIKQTSRVIVGYKRSQLATEQYPSLSDQELLKEGGHDEDALDELYTKASRRIVIFLLFAAYVGMPSCAATAFGCACRKAQLESLSSD